MVYPWYHYYLITHLCFNAVQLLWNSFERIEIIRFNCVKSKLKPVMINVYLWQCLKLKMLQFMLNTRIYFNNVNYLLIVSKNSYALYIVNQEYGKFQRKQLAWGNYQPRFSFTSCKSLMQMPFAQTQHVFTVFQITIIRVWRLF